MYSAHTHIYKLDKSERPRSQFSNYMGLLAALSFLPLIFGDAELDLFRMQWISSCRARQLPIFQKQIGVVHYIIYLLVASFALSTPSTGST